MWQSTKIPLKFHLITKLPLKKMCKEIWFQNHPSVRNHRYHEIQPLNIFKKTRPSLNPIIEIQNQCRRHPH